MSKFNYNSFTDKEFYIKFNSFYKIEKDNRYIGKCLRYALKTLGESNNYDVRVSSYYINSKRGINIIIIKDLDKKNNSIIFNKYLQDSKLMHLGDALRLYDDYVSYCFTNKYENYLMSTSEFINAMSKK